MANRRQFDFAAAGSAMVSRYQLGNKARGGSRTPSSSTAGAAKIVPRAIAPADWTADSTDYPDATELGNPVLYRADVEHSLGSTYAVLMDLQDHTGASIATRIHRKTNEDPASPGDLHYNRTRIWITADTAPADTIVAVFIG